MPRFCFAVLFIVVAGLFGATHAQESRGTVTGRVVTERGKPLADVRVIAVASDEVSVTTNLKGEFVLELAPGDYRLRFEADGYSSTSLRLPISVEAGHVTKLPRRIEMTAARNESIVRGTVFDSVGRTLAGIKVRLERVPGADGASVAPLSRETQSDSMGFYVFHLPGGEGRYRISATSEKHAPSSITVDVAGGEILNAPPLTMQPR